jgi:hypothetical protein
MHKHNPGHGHPPRYELERLDAEKKLGGNPREKPSGTVSRDRKSRTGLPATQLSRC